MRSYVIMHSHSVQPGLGFPLSCVLCFGLGIRVLCAKHALANKFPIHTHKQVKNDKDRGKEG